MMMPRTKTTTPNRTTTLSRRSSENPTNSPHASLTFAAAARTRRHPDRGAVPRGGGEPDQCDDVLIGTDIAHGSASNDLSALFLGSVALGLGCIPVCTENQILQ